MNIYQKIADDNIEEDVTATPYKIDKIFWLICSGNYYLHNIKSKGYKKEFISAMKEEIR